MQRNIHRVVLLVSILAVLPCGVVADIAGPASFFAIIQEGKDIKVVFSDLDHGAHEAGCCGYTLARISNDECMWTVLFKDLDLDHLSTKNKGSSCYWYGEPPLPDSCLQDGQDAGADSDAGGEEMPCDDCDDDGVNDCWGFCECCDYEYTFIDHCVAPGQYIYRLLLPVTGSDWWGEGYDYSEESQYTLADLGNLWNASEMAFAVKESNDKCTIMDEHDTLEICNTSSESSSGGCQIQNHRTVTIGLPFVLVLVGIVALLISRRKTHRQPL